MATALDMASLLECQICMDTYTNPKQLSCDHEYCKRCLDKILHFNADGSATITCPNKCKASTLIPVNKTTNDLHISYVFKHILEALKSNQHKLDVPTPMCDYDDSCKNGVAVYCCGLFVCKSCVHQHQNTQNNHEPCDSMQVNFDNEGEPDEPSQCIDVIFDKEEGELKVMCKNHLTACTHQCSDNQFLCVYCLHRIHKDHVKYRIEEQVEKVKKALTNDLQNTENLHVFVKLTEEAIIEGRQKLVEALQNRKISCLSSYLNYLNKEEECVKEQYENMCEEQKRKYPTAYPKEYYNENLIKSDIQLAIENILISKELSKSGIHNSSLQNITVSLSEQYSFDNLQPLGDLQVVLGEDILFSDKPTSTFIANISGNVDNYKTTLSKLKNDLENMLEESNTTDKPGLAVDLAKCDDCLEDSNGNIPVQQKPIQKHYEDFQQQGSSATKEQKNCGKYWKWLEGLIRAKENEKVKLLLMEQPDTVKKIIGPIGCTPFIFAAQVNNLALMKELVEYGDVFADRDADDGGTALNHAAMGNSVECVEWLLQTQPSLLHVQDTSDGNTPLHDAAYNGSLDALKCLLKFGADINMKNKHGYSPFGLARICQRFSCVAELMKWSHEHSQ